MAPKPWCVDVVDWHDDGFKHSYRLRFDTKKQAYAAVDAMIQPAFQHGAYGYPVASHSALTASLAF